MVFLRGRNRSVYLVDGLSVVADTIGGNVYWTYEHMFLVSNELLVPLWVLHVSSRDCYWFPMWWKQKVLELASDTRASVWLAHALLDTSVVMPTRGFPIVGRCTVLH